MQEAAKGRAELHPGGNEAVNVPMLQHSTFFCESHAPPYGRLSLLCLFRCCRRQNPYGALRPMSPIMDISPRSIKRTRQACEPCR